MSTESQTCRMSHVSNWANFNRAAATLHLTTCNGFNAQAPCTKLIRYEPGHIGHGPTAELLRVKYKSDWESQLSENSCEDLSDISAHHPRNTSPNPDARYYRVCGASICLCCHESPWVMTTQRQLPSQTMIVGTAGSRTSVIVLLTSTSIVKPQLSDQCSGSKPVSARHTFLAFMLKTYITVICANTLEQATAALAAEGAPPDRRTPLYALPLTVITCHACGTISGS